MDWTHVAVAPGGFRALPPWAQGCVVGLLCGSLFLRAWALWDRRRGRE